MRGPASYDFHRCKFCSELSATPTYPLGAGAIIYICQRCDFHFLNILDPPIGTSRQGPLSVADRNYIDSRLHETAAPISPRLALIRRFLDPTQVRCLDIGAGTGQFILALREAGARAWGIEPSWLRRSYAWERFALELYPELVDEAFWQSGKMGKFDLITLWDVLEHVNFPVETLQHSVRLLKPGGWLFLETPSRHSAAYRLSQCVCRLSCGRLPLFLTELYSAGPYGHKQIFTPRQLRDLLERAELELIQEQHTYPGGGLRRDKLIVAARAPK